MAIRYHEFRSSGPHLRSQEMKMPSNIGQKKQKNIDIVIDKLKLGNYLSFFKLNNHFYFYRFNATWYGRNS